MRIKEIVLGKKYKVIDSGLHTLHILRKGETVRAERIVDSIVTNKPRYVKIRVTDKNSEQFALMQTLDPKDLEEIRDDD